MRNVLATGTLMLVAVAAALMSNIPRQPQARATVRAGSSSQDLTESSAMASARASKRKIPCKTPEIASTCYWTHGRLSFYANYPPLRIWKTGTRRLLAVYSGPSHFPARDTSQLFLPELPANLARVYEGRKNWEQPEPLIDDFVYWGRSIFADYEVCPLAPEKEGKMQPVCVEQASKIFVEK